MTVYCHMSTLSVRAVHGPAGTPPRPERSLRRTTSHAVTRPDGLAGPMTATCRGRDLLTGASGAAVTVRQVAVEACAGFDDGRVRRLDCDVPTIDLTPLVGGTAFSGFRAAAQALLGDDDPAASLAYQLLDDLPIALLLSGRVLRAEGISLGRPGRRLPVDICAGWAEGGSLLAGYDEVTGPPLHLGPAAPPVGRADDPAAWHESPVATPRSTARHRRLDVTLAGADQAIVDGWFRDTFTDADGVETVVHEYSLTATVDRHARRFLAGEARPGPLPYVECPGAAASAGRLRGIEVGSTRDEVTAAFSGPTTCTHLNDAMRGLEGVGALLDLLEAGAADAMPHPPEEES